MFSAILWAVAALWWEKLGKSCGPNLLNFAKNTSGAVLFGIQLAWLGVTLPAFDYSVLMLCISGIFGLTIGDSAFFASLPHLGTRQALLVGSMTPALAVFLAAVLGEESLTLISVGGSICVCAGTAIVLTAPRDEQPSEPMDQGKPRKKLRGVVLGLTSSVACALSSVFARKGLGSLGVAEASFIRLSTGAISGAFLLALLPQFRTGGAAFQHPRFISSLGGVVLIGTYGGIWFSLLGLKLAPVSIAATLNSTTPIFGVLLTWIVRKEPLTLRLCLGTAIATLGVGILAIRA